MNRIDPKEFGLHARTVLEQVDEHTVALVMDRKSRIIMADGRKIVEKVEKIQKVRPKITVVLKTSAPVCSKTVTFLQKGGITIHSL